MSVKRSREFSVNAQQKRIFFVSQLMSRINFPNFLVIGNISANYYIWKVTEQKNFANLILSVHVGNVWLSYTSRWPGKLISVVSPRSSAVRTQVLGYFILDLVTLLSIHFTALPSNWFWKNSKKKKKIEDAKGLLLKFLTQRWKIYFWYFSHARILIWAIKSQMVPINIGEI